MFSVIIHIVSLNYVNNYKNWRKPQLSVETEFKVEILLINNKNSAGDVQSVLKNLSTNILK